MNPLQHFSTLVSQSMAASGAPNARATKLVSDGHPDLVILARAYGATGNCVQFMNSRWEAQANAPALKNFHALVNERMRSASCSYDAAIGWVQLHHRDAVQAVNAKPSFANTSSAPVAGPQVRATLRLPTTATQEEVDICYEANGKTLALLNPGKAFAGLVEYLQKRTGLDYEAALRNAKTRYPQLWGACEQVAAQPV